MVDVHRARAVATPGVAAHTTNATAGGRHVLATAQVAGTANLTRVRYVSQSRTATGNGTRATVTVIAANETTVGQYTAVNGNVTLDDRRNRTEVFDRSLRGLSTATNPLRGTLRRGNFTVVDAETVDGTELLTLRADRYAGGQLYETSDVANYTATVRVTGDGLIRSATERIVGTAAVDGRRYEFAYRFEPTAVDLPPTPRIPEEIRAAADTANDTRTPTPTGTPSAAAAST